jgi:hypothetical protein
MSNILEVAKTQFRDRMSGQLKSSNVPEWVVDGKETVIFYKASMNFRDQGEILRLHSDGKQAEAVAMTFILRAMDENGTKLFKRANMTELMRSVDPDIISRVVSEMGGDDVDFEDAARE